MGAALVPLAVGLVGDVVQSVIAPPPAPVVVQPAQVQPDLSQSAAQQIAKTANQKGQQFGSAMMNSITDKARKQGLSDKDVQNVQNEFNSWFNTNSGQINQTMNILAQHSQDQANYTNQINQNNFQTQLAAVNASMPQNNLFGSLVPGLLGGLTGGMNSIPIQTPTIYDPAAMVNTQTMQTGGIL